jgi:EAL domain-containing protein (putative c-di-GMP-specific phosphodiesterase class I)
VQEGLYPTRAQVLVLLTTADAATQGSLVRTLRRRGHDVVTAATVASAREQLERLDVDVVLADFALADGSGLDVLAAAHDRDPELPVLFLAARATTTSNLPVRTLTKPVEEADLLDAIASVRRDDDAAAETPADALADAFAGMYVALQPVVSWSRQEAVSCEVLLRSRHRRLGRPERLLAAAAQQRRISDLGRAARAMAAACIDELPHGDIFVNLHPAELDDDELRDPTSPLARRAGRVILDLSAKAVLDRASAERRIEPLRELGFRIALDDIDDTCGLGTLAVVRPDVLKIDGSLVHGIRRDPLRRAVVRGVLDLGQRLGASTIAEGVETEDDLAGVVDAGGDLVSGFLFGRPAPRLPVIDLPALRHRLAT